MTIKNPRVMQNQEEYLNQTNCLIKTMDITVTDYDLCSVLHGHVTQYYTMIANHSAEPWSRDPRRPITVFTPRVIFGKITIINAC